MDTEKSAIGANGQIQFGTVLGGSAKVAVLAALPGAFADAVVAFGDPLPEEHPVNANKTTAILPNIRKIGFRIPP
ncbi:hypothetical protein [Arthrobacter livingstonensis]|uniref:hypothetical protein n=1 Tax=Arthrobacter livingstonensis TaxID=670078 RepID=UPI0014761A63|nr:hypothetical protein [Arthrobacter livingstonensis]